MLLGQPATQVCFDIALLLDLPLPANFDGPTPPPGTPNFLLSLGSNKSSLNFHKFHVDFTNPANSTLTGPTPIAVATYAGSVSAPQPGVSSLLTTSGEHLSNRLVYRDTAKEWYGPGS